MKIVKRIVKAMVNNCSKIESKCPREEPFCRVLWTACRGHGRELVPAEHLKELDEIFRPSGVPMLGDPGVPLTEF